MQQDLVFAIQGPVIGCPLCGAQNTGLLTNAKHKSGFSRIVNNSLELFLFLVAEDVDYSSPSCQQTDKPTFTRIQKTFYKCDALKYGSPV